MKIQTEPFCKVAAVRADAICQRFELSDEARSHAAPTLSPQALLALLVDNGHVSDAVRFLAFALPIREAIWWACVTTRDHGDAVTSTHSDCLQCAGRWVYEPTEDNRVACMAAAERAQHEGAAAYAALAVFWSGGSIAPTGMPEVLPDPNLAAIGVGASILLALADGDPAAYPARFESALRCGIDIANGGNGDAQDGRSPCASSS